MELINPNNMNTPAPEKKSFVIRLFIDLLDFDQKIVQKYRDMKIINASSLLQQTEKPK